MHGKAAVSMDAGCLCVGMWCAGKRAGAFQSIRARKHRSLSGATGCQRLSLLDLHDGHIVAISRTCSSTRAVCLSARALDFISHVPTAAYVRTHAQLHSPTILQTHALLFLHLLLQVRLIVLNGFVWACICLHVLAYMRAHSCLHSAKHTARQTLLH